MTNTEREKLRWCGAAMIAHSEDRPVQILGYNGWEDCLLPQWAPNRSYRPKPEPVTRPWRAPEDVPLYCWLRNTEHPGWMAMVVGFYRFGLRIVHSNIGEIEWEKLSGYEHSTDRREWKPCTVTEP